MTTQLPPLVIYHGNCPDGFTSAWVCSKTFGADLELLAAKYGDEPPLQLAAGRAVYVVDFSYPRAELERLHAAASALVVLDHHKTAEAELAGLPYCIFDMQRSGAGLTWDYFNPNTPRPWIVDYVEDRDLWRFKLPDSELISLRIRLTPHELLDYDVLASIRMETVLAEAAGAKLYLDNYVQDALRNAYDLPDVWHGLTMRCINMGYTGVSDVLNAALADGQVQVAIGYHVAADGGLNCSVRSTKDVDSSGFAKLHGGGGHAQACGFHLDIGDPLVDRLLRRSGAPPVAIVEADEAPVG